MLCGEARSYKTVRVAWTCKKQQNLTWRARIKAETFSNKDLSSAEIKLHIWSMLVTMTRYW